MPCGCKASVDKYPETADWGPLVWTLLHGLAEKVGRQTTKLIQEDEIRLWIQLITSLKNTIPCDICSEHYGRWLISHPLSQLTLGSYANTSEWIRNFFWKLHNEINEGNDKSILPLSDLSSLYKNTNITETWKKLDPVMILAIRLNGISLLSWKTWLACVRRLQGLYG